GSAFIDHDANTIPTGTTDATITCADATATPTPSNTATATSTFTATPTPAIPPIDGIAKDTGIPPDENFSFSVGNLWLCKALGSANTNLPPVSAFSGAGETACGTFQIAEVVQEPKDIDSCVDDDDADGKACAGDPTHPPAAWQNQSDGCLNIASDYVPAVTRVDCNGGEVGEGLGAAERQAKFDDKICQSPPL